jgi:hypothetical protein
MIEVRDQLDFPMWIRIHRDEVRTPMVNFDEMEKNFQAEDSISLLEFSIGSTLDRRKIKLGT